MDRPEPLDQDLDLRRQDGHLDRLGYVFVGALRVTGEDVIGLLARREHDHRDPGRTVVSPETAGQLESVHVRHVHVGDDEVGHLRADRLERLPSVVRQRHLVPVPGEPGRQKLADLLLVVDEDDAFAGHQLLANCAMRARNSVMLKGFPR